MISILSLCTVGLLTISIHKTSGHVYSHSHKDDICSQLGNVSFQIPCEKLEAVFKPNNCTDSDSSGCVDTDAMEECFHGLLVNGSKYTAESDCLQFYCNCSENLKLNMSAEFSVEMSNGTMNSIELAMKNHMESHPELMNMSNDLNMNSTDEMDSNATTWEHNMTQQSGKYVKSPEAQEPGSPAPNQRNGRGKSDYVQSTTTIPTAKLSNHDTSTRNIYDNDNCSEDDDTTKNKLMDNPHHGQGKSSHSHNDMSGSGSNKHWNDYSGMLVLFALLISNL